MHRFFLSADQFHLNEIAIPAELSRQMTRVLRLEIGSEVILLDDQGFEYIAALSEVNDRECKAVVRQQQPAQGEPETKLTLILGLTQREKFEWILQKCTEIGVTSFLPVTTSRSLIQKPEDVHEKYPRWKKIIIEAAEQSRRGRIPVLLPALSFIKALSIVQSNDALKLILWEDEVTTGIKYAVRNHQGKNVQLFVGPEGGFSKEEVDIAKQAGFISVSLGKRILRMETAAMMSSGLVIYELG
ncbi:MAG: 16S rRNA (uracil1498-N3)-methyltransferase [Chloroflexi bacterium]|nr:MAG: 16S rRNA (uracil1498-N3)-methyltransferase [Chloroflexota bacterium]